MSNQTRILAARLRDVERAESRRPLNRIAEAHQPKPIQIALAWLLRRSPIMLPIPGTSSVEHLEENIAAAALRLTQAEYDQLSAVSRADSPPSIRSGSAVDCRPGSR